MSDFEILYIRSLVRLFCTSALSFKDNWILCLHASCDRFPRFTSGVTPTGFLMVSIAPPPFWPHTLAQLVSSVVGVQNDDRVCSTVKCSQNYIKLAMLPTNWQGKSKIKSAKNALSGDGTQNLLVFTLMPCWLSKVNIWLSVWIFES